jgi:hypothetical protein
VPVPAFALLVAIVALVSACGDGGGDSHAEHLYNAYRTAEDQRTEAESRLRQAFSDISLAASQEDRAGVLAAANRGRDAAAEIDRLLSAELEAANGLSRIETVAADGKRLAQGIELTRHGLDLEAKELEIALEDPFLATRADEVRKLARQSTNLAVRGELAIRRADRAIAIALGLEPRADQLATTG